MQDPKIENDLDETGWSYNQVNTSDLSPLCWVVDGWSLQAHARTVTESQAFFERSPVNMRQSRDAPNGGEWT